jgi:hypothetical protein
MSNRKVYVDPQRNYIYHVDRIDSMNEIWTHYKCVGGLLLYRKTNTLLPDTPLGLIPEESWGPWIELMTRPGYFTLSMNKNYNYEPTRNSTSSANFNK